MSLSVKVEDLGGLAGGFNGTTPLSSTAQVTVNVVNITIIHHC